MYNVIDDKAAKMGDLLFRYMRARHRFKQHLEPPLPAHELTALIDAGKTEFDEIYVEPDPNPSIVFDGKADDVFDAIIKKKYRAIPSFDPQLVAAWRLTSSATVRCLGNRVHAVAHKGGAPPMKQLTNCRIAP
jgi:hypothetical protein